MRIIAAETMRNCRQDSAIGVGLHVNSNDSVTHDYIIRLAFCGYMTVLFCYQELYVHFTVYRDLRVQPMVNRSLERGKNMNSHIVVQSVISSDPVVMKQVIDT